MVVGVEKKEAIQARAAIINIVKVGYFINVPK